MLKKIATFFLQISVVIALIITLFITAVNYEVFGRIYTSDELQEFSNETASIVLSDNGIVIGKYFNENRTNVTYNQLPKHLINALIATEDSRYFEHRGVDARSMFRVLFKTILLNNKRSGGGSTITQQLAKNMYGRANYGPLTMVVNKTKEAIQAYRIEKTFTKEEILTLYLNTVSFGENIYGIETASLRYFNKETAKLTINEAAVLIGILKANTYYNPRLHPKNALNRRNTVLAQMLKHNYVKQQTFDSLKRKSLNLNYTNLVTTNKSGYFLTIVKRKATAIIDSLNDANNSNWNIEKDGLQIHTTLDITLQNYGLNAFKKHLSNMQQQFRKHYALPHKKRSLDEFINNKLKKLNRYENKLERRQQLIFDWEENYSDSISIVDSLSLEATLLHAGMLAINPNNGAIKSWIGGINYNTHPYDQILAQRQLASTFKPLLYTAALESGRKPCEYLNNEELIISDYNNWSPKNANKSKGGKYSMAGALMNSMNIPSVNLFLETGYTPIDTLWKKMQFSSPLENSPSLALGTANASIYEVARAYTAYGNNGEFSPLKCINKITTAEGKVLYKQDENISEKILSDRSTQLINTILQRAINNGTGTSLRNTYKVSIPIAGKTGTSQNYADAWFVAYNPNLVMVSRVGATSPKIHFSNANGAGSKLALPLVALSLKEIENNKLMQQKYVADFPEIPNDLLNELDCEDYKEKTGLENFFDLFKKKETNFKKAQKKTKHKQEKESFFKKLFKPKKKSSE